MVSRRGAIFDLDGTLIDSLDDISDSMNIALSQHAQPRVSRDVVRRAVGDGVRTLCAKIRKNLSQNVLDGLCASFSRAYETQSLVRTRPYAGISEALAALRAAGISSAVLSNKPHVFTQKIVAALFDENAFVCVIGADDVHHRKPAPAGALGIAKIMNLAPRDVWIIGDSDVNIQTARAADMRAAAVTWGFRSGDELRACNPDAIMTRPSDIVDLLLHG